MDFSIFDILTTGEGITYLVILTLLEIVLGIDNIIFISIISDKLPQKQRKTARNLGLAMALVARLGLLAAVSWIMGMTKVLFTVFGRDFTGQSIVLLLGGLFLIYKSTTEMHNSVTGKEEKHGKTKATLGAVITQIVLVDVVFSFDSVISAIGMTNKLEGNPMVIIYIAVIISMIVMMIFARQISEFISKRPTIKMLALSFLVAIGVILVAEAFGEHVPKGYIYFALVYSLIVEFLNIRMRKNRQNRRERESGGS